MREERTRGLVSLLSPDHNQMKRILTLGILLVGVLAATFSSDRG